MENGQRVLDWSAGHRRIRNRWKSSHQSGSFLPGGNGVSYACGRAGWKFLTVRPRLCHRPGCDRAVRDRPLEPRSVTVHLALHAADDLACRRRAFCTGGLDRSLVSQTARERGRLLCRGALGAMVDGRHLPLHVGLQRLLLIAYAQMGYMYGWVAVTLFWVSVPACVAGRSHFCSAMAARASSRRLSSSKCASMPCCVKPSLGPVSR